MEFPLIFTLLIASVALLAAGEDKPPNDSLILGMYRTQSAEDLKAEDLNEYLKAMEYSDEAREKMRECISIHVKIERGWGTNVYKTAISCGFQIMVEQFTLGEEFDATLFDGRKYKATMTFSDNVATRVEKHGSFESGYVATFSKEGYEVEFRAKDKTAKMKLGRIRDGEGDDMFQGMKDKIGDFFKGKK